MWNSVSTQNTKSRSWPKLRYVVVSTAAERSTTRLGTDGSSSIPMKSESALRYAPARMLPASLRHDCSNASNTAVVPTGRRSSMSQTRRPTDSGNSSSVRPVRSPSMCISTAATTSCGFPSRSGTSSRRTMLSCGSAVAAWPAPMFATSRNASICSSLRSRTSSMPPPLQEPARIENQRGNPVAHDRRTAEYGQRSLRCVEPLHDDLLLTQHPVHHDAAASLAHLEHDDGTPGRRVPAHAEQTSQVYERHHVVA